jgi:hypothetical protein
MTTSFLKHTRMGFPARFITGFLLLATPLAAQTPEETFDEVVGSITVDEIQEHVNFLAGPTTRGRGTLTPGFEIAAQYVEAQLTELGLEAAGPEGSYRLPIKLNCIGPSEKSYFEIGTKKGEKEKLKVGIDFVPMPGSSNKEIEGEPVFVGFAIDARKENWEDLSPRKVKDKVVFAFTREPYADDQKTKRFDGLEVTKHSEWAEKARAVKAAGGVALVLIPDPGIFPEEVGPIPNLLEMPMWPGGNARQLERMAGFAGLPVASVSRKVASDLFGTDIDKYYQSILKRKKPKQLKVKGKKLVRFKSDLRSMKVPAYNLAARIPGSGDSGNVVVLGAHLDHVGLNYYADKGRVRVHPGADDNASGTAALLEVAEALAGKKPQVDVLLLWFTGEENGLLGSRAYCEDPLYPHDKTLVMLNMDQIARTDPDEMFLGGVWDSNPWKRLIAKLNKRVGSPLKVETDGHKDMYTRSDQWAFAQKEVPAIFFFEGNIDKNKVYHKPGDVADSILTEKVMWIARLFVATAWSVAWEGERP